MSSPLTSGFCQQAFSAESDTDSQPVVQVLSVKKINAQGASTTDRYRIILSDGIHFIQSMLATQLNPFVEDKSLDKNVVIKLTQFVVNQVQGRKLVIVLGLDIVPWDGEKIGNPVNLEQATVSAGAAAPAQAPAAAAGGEGGNGPQAPSRTGSAAGKPAGRNGKDMGPIFPIEGLSPYQNKWTIKARVTHKSDIKHYSNQRGEGKVFNVTFMDETGEIRATGFNEQADAFYDILQEGKVYFLTKARVNIAKKQFNNVNNEYEIMLDRDTAIDHCDDESVPQVRFKFKGIDELGDLQKDEITDVIGVVNEVQELGSITSKASQRPFAKRELQLVDRSGQSVKMTLWGKQAETYEHMDQPVIAFKGVKVGDFGGRSLSMFSGATMVVNPDLPEAHALRGWYDSEGRSSSFTAYSNTTTTRSDNNVVKPSENKTINDAKETGLGMNEKPDYFNTQATVAFIKQETFNYPACANPDGCNKKVMDNGDGWLCEKCDRKWPEPIYRYILQMNLMDHTGQFWITAFNEVAEQLMGISANDLQRMKDTDENQFSKAFQDCMGKTFTFQMMAKQDSYNDVAKVRYQCRKATTPDYAAESAHLKQMIDNMSF